ncbi:MAG: LysR family transcriptional regulator [Pseudomonadota bacterium]
MIDHLRAMAIFAAVADTGSFSAAARKLQLTTSGVSQHIRKLETQLGVTVFYRSTRSLSLTHAGQVLLPHVHRMITAAEDGLASITPSQGPVSGHLTITLPAFMAGGAYEQALWNFAHAHAGVEFTLRYLDQTLDLVSNGIDLALRLGNLTDSALKSKRLGSFGRILVSAPSYLQTAPPLHRPTDLQQHHFIGIEGVPTKIDLDQDGHTETIAIQKTKVSVDNFIALRSALRAGLGIQRLPLSVAAPDIAAGLLVRVLPHWSIPDLGVYGVWPDTLRQGSLKAQVLDHLQHTPLPHEKTPPT